MVGAAKNCGTVAIGEVSGNHLDLSLVDHVLKVNRATNMSAATVFFYCGLILASGASLKEDIFAAKDLASSVAPLAVAEAERIYGKGIPMEGVRRETRRLA